MPEGVSVGVGDGAGVAVGKGVGEGEADISGEAGGVSVCACGEAYYNSRYASPCSCARWDSRREKAMYALSSTTSAISAAQT